MALSKTKLQQLRSSQVGKTGNRLADAIELTGETSTAIAEALGFTLQYVSDVSRGRFQTITVDNARKFAEYFGCSIEDLFPARDEHGAVA